MARRRGQRITVCGEHDERDYELRFAGAVRFLYGSAERGRVVRRFGSPIEGHSLQDETRYLATGIE